MTDKKDMSIAEALAEVQRIANQQKGLRVAEMAAEIAGEPLDEEGAIATGIKAVSNFLSNVKRGATVSGPSVKAIEKGAGGKFTSPGTASKSGLAVGKTVKPVVDNPKAAALGAAGGAAGTAAGISAMKSSSDAPASSSAPSSSSSSSASPQKKQTFGQAFADARKAAGGKGGKFTYGGKEYNTAVRGEKKIATSKLRNVNPKGPTNEETEVNPQIASFLELMGSKSGNIFEAAKHLSAKQKKLAATAGDPEKIDAEDLKALRSKKMEEESKDFLGGSTITKDPKKYVDPSTPKVPYSQLPKPGNKAGEVISKAKGAAGMKEEVSFTESELAHFEAVAKKSVHLRLGKGNEDERGMGDTVSDADTTN